MTTIQNKPCKVCREDRLAERKPPRSMVVLPTWTKGENKQKRKYPVYVCEFCDGPVLQLAKRKVADDT